MSQNQTPSSLLNQTPGLLGSTADIDRNKLLAAIQQALVSIAGTTATNGTWTPTDSSGAALTFTSVDAEYTQIGNLVFAMANLTYPTTASGSSALIGGLPIASANRNAVFTPAILLVSGGLANTPIIFPSAGTTHSILRYQGTGAAITNAQLSTLSISFMLVYSTV